MPVRAGTLALHERKPLLCESENRADAGGRTKDPRKIARDAYIPSSLSHLLRPAVLSACMSPLPPSPPQPPQSPQPPQPPPQAAVAASRLRCLHRLRRLRQVPSRHGTRTSTISCPFVSAWGGETGVVQRDRRRIGMEQGQEVRKRKTHGNGGERRRFKNTQRKRPKRGLVCVGAGWALIDSACRWPIEVCLSSLQSPNQQNRLVILGSPYGAVWGRFIRSLSVVGCFTCEWHGSDHDGRLFKISAERKALGNAGRFRVHAYCSSAGVHDKKRGISR